MNAPHLSKPVAGLTLALVGPHGAGKTTVGRRVASMLGVPFDDEIGRRMRDEALERDPEAHAIAAGRASTVRCSTRAAPRSDAARRALGGRDVARR